MGAWDDRKVLVTGAGGFIGGHLAVALVRAGARVRALCRYSSRRDRGTLDWFTSSEPDELEVVFGDLRDSESIRAAVLDTEVVFHLGAQISIPYSFLNPRDFFETNVLGTLNVAQAALEAGCARVVHLSTSEVYGEPEEVPIPVAHRLAPRSPYAASKAGADMLMLSMHHAQALPVTVARPFNAYGPHQSARAIVPTIAVQALRGGPVVLGALEPRRDLTFVEDTVAGLMSIAECAAAIGRTLQLGTGEAVSVRELVDLIGELLDRELEIERDEQRVRPSGAEIGRLVCQSAATTELTGWRPGTDLRRGLSETLDWLRANPHRYRAQEYAR